jgi:hypothetical protein
MSLKLLSNFLLPMTPDISDKSTIAVSKPSPLLKPQKDLNRQTPEKYPTRSFIVHTNTGIAKLPQAALS